MFEFTNRFRTDLYTFWTASGAQYIVDPRSLHVTRLAHNSGNVRFGAITAYRLMKTPDVFTGKRVTLETELGPITTTAVEKVEILLRTQYPNGF